MFWVSCCSLVGLGHQPHHRPPPFPPPRLPLTFVMTTGCVERAARQIATRTTCPPPSPVLPSISIGFIAVVVNGWQWWVAYGCLTRWVRNLQGANRGLATRESKKSSEEVCGKDRDVIYPARQGRWFRSRQYEGRSFIDSRRMSPRPM